MIGKNYHEISKISSLIENVTMYDDVLGLLRMLLLISLKKVIFQEYSSRDIFIKSNLGLYWVLQIECCVLPKFICCNSNPQDDSIRMRGLWEMIRS